MCSIYHTLFDYYLNLCYTTLVIFAGVAQSVAHLIGSEEVTGSIPVISLYSHKNTPLPIGDGVFQLLLLFSTLVIHASSIGTCVKQLQYSGMQKEVGCVCVVPCGCKKKSAAVIDRVSQFEKYFCCIPVVGEGTLVFFHRFLGC